MTNRNRRRWRIIIDYIIGWTFAFIFLSIVRGVGTTELGAVQFEFWSSITVSLISGPFFGAVSGYAQLITEEKIYRRSSIQKLLIIRFIYAAVFLIGLIIIFYFISRIFFGLKIGIIQFAFEPGSFAIYFYILMIDVVLGILRQVNLLLGPKKLRELLRGKFYNPHEEVRIFMFIDLQDSTLLAEKLGHIQYSKLIQDCFNDLGVVVENEAEIYQYVGDEVILTWKLDDGLRNLNCINAFFNFKKRLAKKENYYAEKYNCKPHFKAGMNAGVVTVTEVGKYKKEIVYHGDTINTASRIQAQCNVFKKEFLVADYFKDKFKNLNTYSFEEIGNISLKGKSNDVLIYAVSIPENVVV